MKKVIFTILIMGIITSCKEQKKNSASNHSDKTLNGEPINLSGKMLEYNYGSYIYEINFKSDNELHWKCTKGDEKGKEADEIYSTQRLNKNMLFISWVEQDGLGVSQVINLKDNTITCFLKIDKKIIPLNGTIQEL